MNSLFDNAIQSIQIGIEDYEHNDPKRAPDLFEVEIAWGERDSKQYPVIVVPSGVKVPVAAKRDLKDGSRTALRVGAVYFRSLASNGTPSTTEARPSDWAEIVEICFDNREADVGRFIRRHLASLDISSLMSFLGQPSLPEKSCRRLAGTCQGGGDGRSWRSCQRRSKNASEQRKESILICLQSLEWLALDARHDTGNQPARQAQLDYGNQRRIHVEGDQGSTKVIRLALLWHGGSVVRFTSAPMDVLIGPQVVAHFY